jgi:hypothetical protein
MKRVASALIICWSLTALSPLLSAEPVRAAVLRCYLFYEHSGTWSRDICGQDPFILWNVLIGGGDAKEPSNSLLIEAVFTGSSGSYRPTRNIAIRATMTKNNRRVVDEKAQTGVFSPSGEWRFIALARGPFCEPLRVDVLVDGKVEKTAVLNFQCGE